MATGGIADLKMRRELANGYVSASQIARVLTESWAEHQLPSPCHAAALVSFTANTKVKDFRCSVCNEEFQLKSQKRMFGKRILGAEYNRSYQAALMGWFPSLLLLTYSDETWSVVNLIAVHRFTITPDLIKARSPLSSTARRAGWQGCHINLERIPKSGRITLVDDGRPNDFRSIVNAWESIKRINVVHSRNRTWLLDVLSCIEQLPSTFILNDAYAFECELRGLHPANQNIRPKIRQQLQVLRANGMLNFDGNGVYSKRF